MKRYNVADIRCHNHAVLVVTDMMQSIMTDWLEAGWEGDFVLEDVKATAKEILVDSNYDDLSRMQILWIMRV